MSDSIRVPKLRNIHITDPLFGGYAALVASVIIPYQWGTLNNRVEGAKKSYCIENFRIAAGEKRGERQGVVFCDTDAYKWLEAVAYCIENGSGARFIPLADGLIDLICRAQCADGYLNTYYAAAHPEQRWKNLNEGHELYCAGHLIEAGVAYYNATGKDALLNASRRFADLICGVFGPEEGKCHGYPGHQEIEVALVKLWRATGERRYLDLAKYFIDARGRQPNYLAEEVRARNGASLFPELGEFDPEYAQTHLPPVAQKTAEGHAVRALYMYSAMADLARIDGDETLADACRALWQNITSRRMYITGGLGSSGAFERFTVDYDLPNDRMYCESCASVGLMMFGQRMAALTGDAAYYGAVERALCNTLLAGIAATGDRYFYVNPLEVWPDNCKPFTAMAHVKPVRQPWFDVACCPPNIARTLASLGQYIYAEDDDSLYINQFISSEITTDLHGPVSVRFDAALMRGGPARISAQTAGRGCTLRLRIPEWLEAPVFTMDGAAFSPAVERGYALLPVPGGGGHTFELRGGVRPRFVAANLNVRADAGKIALMKGPFLYCLEETDNGGHLANIYASPRADVTEGAPLSGLPGALPTLRYRGRRLTRSTLDGDALYSAPAFTLEETELTSVPYCLWNNRAPGEMLVWQKCLL